jgi:hypothetical protein
MRPCKLSVCLVLSLFVAAEASALVALTLRVAKPARASR